MIQWKFNSLSQRNPRRQQLPSPNNSKPISQYHRVPQEALERIKPGVLFRSRSFKDATN